MSNAAYSVYSYSYSNINGETKESNKAYSKNEKGNEKFHIVEKKNEKIVKDVEGKKSSTSNSFTLKSNSKLEEMDIEKEKVYKMLAKELGLDYKEAIKSFLESKEYRQLTAKSSNTQKGG